MTKKHYIIREDLIDTFIDAVFNAVAKGKQYAIDKRLGGDKEFKQTLARGEAAKKDLKRMIQKNRKDPKWYAEYKKELDDLGLDDTEDYYSDKSPSKSKKK